MKPGISSGQIEAAVCGLVTRLHLGLMGRGPRSVRASLAAESLVICLEGVMTRVEEQLLASPVKEDADAAEMVRQMRDLLVQQARGQLMAALTATLGRQPRAMLHDIDPASGCEVLVFILPRESATPPDLDGGHEFAHSA